MPIPLLNTLPRTARAAYPIIVGGVRRGLSTRQIESAVRAAGLQISRGRSIVPLRRELLRQDVAAAALRFVNKNKLINLANLPPSVTPIRGKYSFTYKFTGLDWRGQAMEGFLTVTSDQEALTPGELDESALEAAEGDQRYPATITSLTLETALQSIERFL